MFHLSFCCGLDAGILFPILSQIETLEKRDSHHPSVYRGASRVMLEVSAEAADKIQFFPGSGGCEITRETFTT